jgi:hypothetical protein
VGASAAACPPKSEGRPPSLACVAELLHAVQACCRHWKHAVATADLPLRVTVGRSALTPRPDTNALGPAPLLKWLASHPLAALHFATSNFAGCSPREVQQLACELLTSARVHQASGKGLFIPQPSESDPYACCAGPHLPAPCPAASTLRELAVWDFVCSRPLCAQLPRFPHLRSLTLTAYLVDLGAALRRCGCMRCQRTRSPPSSHCLLRSHRSGVCLGTRRHRLIRFPVFTCRP